LAVYSADDFSGIFGNDPDSPPEDKPVLRRGNK